MTAQEAKICDMIFNEGETGHAELYKVNGVEIEQYSIIYHGYRYDLTMHDGQWVYLFRHNEKIG